MCIVTGIFLIASPKFDYSELCELSREKKNEVILSKFVQLEVYAYTYIKER